MVKGSVKKLLDNGVKVFTRYGNLSLTAAVKKDTESTSTELIIVLRRDNGPIIPADLEWAEKELGG